jgi:hypothetical protein
MTQNQPKALGSPHASHSATGRRTLLAISAVTVLMAFSPIPARADTVEVAWGKIKSAIACTTDKTCKDDAEAKMIHAAGQAVIDQDKKNNKTIKGNAGLNGFPSDGVIQAEFLVPGSLNVMTFEWFNPLTLMPTTGPVIASVMYAYSQTPDIPSSYTFLGLSTNSLTDFALQFTAFSTEEAIVATPLDAMGNPIYIPDVDGIGNLASGTAVQLISPEPSTLLLIGSGLLPLAAAVRVRRRRMI